MNRKIFRCFWNRNQKTIVELSGGFDLFLAKEEEYPEFKKYGTMKTLKNITGGDMLPEFSGAYEICGTI